MLNVPTVNLILSLVGIDKRKTGRHCLPAFWFSGHLGRTGRLFWGVSPETGAGPEALGFFAVADGNMVGGDQSLTGTCFPEGVEKRLAVRGGRELSSHQSR